MQRLLLAVVLFGSLSCGGGDSPSDSAKEGAPSETGVELVRPQGVALCYSETSSTHPATNAFWEAMRGGRLEDRAAVTEQLKAAGEEYPDEEELALLSGLVNLWRLAEPMPSQLDDTSGLIEAALASRRELERAYALCPTDHRIPAWLGPVLVNTGRRTNSQETIDQGLAVLQQGIDAYPGFVLFSKLLIYASRPKTDPDFQLAVSALEENVAVCNDRDPGCVNRPHAAHNIEGAGVFLGDTYAKAGNKAGALQWYRSAMDAAEYGEWDYQALLADRIATLDDRIAAFDTEESEDDPVSAWSDTNQCSICHRQ